MKLSNFDLIILIIMMFIVTFVYEQIKNMLCSNKETFQSTTTGYTTDIEAIRNLSSIATQLTLSGGLVVPGALQINSKLDLSGNLNIGNSKYASGSSNVSIAPSGAMLTFDNTYNGTVGSGTVANKIRLHNNNNTGIYGFGLESGAIAYQSGANHNFYVSSGSSYGNLALTLDSSKNEIVYGKIATNGLDPTKIPSTISGGIVTYGVYSTNTIATGTTGSDLKAYMNNKGEGYFTGRVDVSGNDLFSNNLPITRNYIVGTLSCTSTTDSTTYKQVTISSVISSPYVTISGTKIKFNYANLYKIEGSFTVSAANNVSDGSTYDSAYFIFSDISGNLPTTTYINVSTSYSDGYPTYVNSENKFKGKIANNQTAHPNCNYFTYLIVPTVGKEYYFLAKKHKISSGTFVISAV